MSIKYFMVICSALLCCFSCKDTNSGESPKPSQQQLDSLKLAQEQEQAAKAEVNIFAWVDKLRVREEPDANSKILVELNEGDSLVFLKEKTDFTQKISIRGKVFDEPWLKVRTRDNKTGWVFGGGVKFYAPKLTRQPALYDVCFELLKDYRQMKFEECFKVEQAKQLQRTAGIVESTDEALSLRLLTGEKVVLENDTSSHRPVAHRFYYYYPQMSCFVVEAIYEDGSDFLLIDDKSGKQVVTWGYPKPSPDNQQWVCSFIGDQEGPDKLGGIQILARGNNGLEVVWQEATNEEPHVPYWLGEDIIEVTMKKKGSPKTFVKTIVRGAGGKWGWK
jgi:Bacterial SH3 domain